ncbi:hypothetical protein [uncultured Treponema sp.]|uniref:hypothetical protein n=1 Tax=uncultured Treponema sp. TaxID=162155 RepID=UPI0026297CB0|nr:hypothetical protein [uncultured Treponema sp.]
MLRLFCKACRMAAFVIAIFIAISVLSRLLPATGAFIARISAAAHNILSGIENFISGLVK